MSDSLEALQKALQQAVDGYTDASGPAGFQQRKQIIARAQDIIDDVRDPHEKPFDYCVSMAEMGALRVLMDWGALGHIPPDGAISYADLAAKVGAEEALLRRVAWMLVSTGVLIQVGTDRVAHTKLSPVYARALVYFLRRTMHDWSDKYNAQVLGHCRDAMAPHSRILIMDQVMPNPPTTLSCQTDICMMNLGAKERTVEDRHTLVDLAGLDLVKIWQVPSSEVAVIECKKRVISSAL